MSIRNFISIDRILESSWESCQKLAMSHKMTVELRGDLLEHGEIVKFHPSLKNGGENAFVLGLLNHACHLYLVMIVTNF